MNSEIKRLKDEIAKTEQLLHDLKYKLNNSVSNCRHQWGNPVYDPIIIPGGYDPGDPPGTMGIDWRGPTSWPEQRKPRWKRVCGVCGMEQYTTNTTKTVSESPQF